MNLFKKFKEEKQLLIILVLHLILAACHLTFNLFSDIQYHAEFRAAGCILIALFIFLFGRRGMSYAFLIYACSLIYLNTFYNYGTIFFLLIAYGAYPKIKWPAIIIYSLNVFVSFSLKKLIPIAVLIHFIYLGLFILITISIYKVKPSKTLKLKEDEIIDIEINDITINNNSVNISSYEQIKNENKRSCCHIIVKAEKQRACEKGQQNEG